MSLQKKIYVWSPNDPCFDYRAPSFEGLNLKNREQTSCRYISSHPKNSQLAPDKIGDMSENCFGKMRILGGSSPLPSS